MLQKHRQRHRHDHHPTIATALLGLLISLANTQKTLSLSSPSPLPPIKAAVIVPGFLTGKQEFQPLADALTARGIPSVVVPMPNWHWLPCLGGRSMRPVLERIDSTVRHLAGNNGDISSIPEFDYNVFDLVEDFKNTPGGVMSVGGSAEVDEYPLVRPRGKFEEAPSPKGRVVLIGHSAGGWISRVYLSRRNYAGKCYNGDELVHSLVTLGTPHGNAPGAAFRGVEWCNREPLGETVRGLAVGGVGYPGDRSGTFTQGAYSFCCADGSDGTQYDGDGVTPIESSLAMGNAETVTLEGVTHFPWSDVFGGDFVAPDLHKAHKEGAPWYGSNEMVAQWAGWLDTN